MQKDSTREPFDNVVNSSGPMEFKIVQQRTIFPILNLLIIGSSIGLFYYVNSYWIATLTYV